MKHSLFDFSCICRRCRGASALLLFWFAAVGNAEELLRDPYFGQHIHRADSGTVWPKAAFGSWRLWDAGVAWPDLQAGKERWDFTRLDRYVAMSRLTGVDVLLPLGLTPTWASARPTEKSSYRAGWAAEPTNIEDWRRYVRTVAQRYRGRVHNYEIWNEISDKGFYTGSTEKMVELTCEAHRILHDVAPENRLVSPSLVGAGTGPEQLESFLRKGGKACVDIIGYHFYIPVSEPEKVVALVQRVRASMKHQGTAGVPLWNTESGWWMENGDGTPQPTADKDWRKVRVDEGAAVVARALILGRWAGLERFYWYAWDNTNLGLVEPSTGALKPAAVAYQTLIGWMAFVTPQCSESMGTWVCALPDNAAGQTRRIVWQASGRPASFILPVAERAVAIERLDGTRQLLNHTMSFNVALGAEPMLVLSVPNGSSVVRKDPRLTGTE